MNNYIWGSDLSGTLQGAGALGYEPMIAIARPGEDTFLKWKRTWSKPGMMQVSGPVVTATGQHLTFVDYIWGEDIKNIELEVHRRIYRAYLRPYNNIDVEHVDEELPTLRFTLKDMIGTRL